VVQPIPRTVESERLLDGIGSRRGSESKLRQSIASIELEVPRAIRIMVAQLSALQEPSDNAAMIAGLGFHALTEQGQAPLDLDAIAKG